MNELRDRLRSLPGFPSDLPVLDADEVPEDPDELFGRWLEEEIVAGARQPHAMTFLTVGEGGAPEGRTLILKDIDRHGYHVSTHRTSVKGGELGRDPRASMVFFWRESGRQVRISGEVVLLPEGVSQADWAARPTYDGAPNPDWQVYALQPTAFEFLQARQDRRHTRVGYRRTEDGWTHAPVTTPAG